MAKPEREITIRHDPNDGIVLTTAEKESFVSPEAALKEKKGDVLEGNIARGVRAIGVAGLLGGVSLTIASVIDYNPAPIIIGLFLCVAGETLFFSAKENSDRKALAEEQIRKINESAGVKNPQ